MFLKEIPIYIKYISWKSCDIHDLTKISINIWKTMHTHITNTLFTFTVIQSMLVCVCCVCVCVSAFHNMNCSRVHKKRDVFQLVRVCVADKPLVLCAIYTVFIELWLRCRCSGFACNLSNLIHEIK